MNLLSMKVINDPVHGCLQLHRFAELILATPQFQRLRGLKQLGLLELVFPAANKTRFEHSIGTYHLAWELCARLQEQMTPQEFSRDEALCVAIAGLCHDLGHGPFSHLWESLVGSLGHKGYHHEDMSAKVFDSIAEDIAVMTSSDAREFSAFMQTQWRAGISRQGLIKDLILGGPGGDGAKIPPDCQFMFEIVNNKRTGFDVDKMDYINRDSQSLGLPTRFDPRRQILLLRAMPCEMPDGQVRRLLVMRDKQLLDYAHLLNARRYNHCVGYQHVKSIAFEKILEDALAAACEHLQAGSPDGLADPEAVECLLRDPTSLRTLLGLTDDRLKQLLTDRCGPEAGRLMRRFDSRQKYTHLASAEAALRCDADATSYEAQIAAAKQAVKQWNSRGWRQGGTIAELRKLDYGSDTRHPLSNVFYYTKAGEVRRCRDQSQRSCVLFTDLLLSGVLHLCVVRLFRRTPVADPDAPASAKTARDEDVQRFYAEMEKCGFQRLDE